MSARIQEYLDGERPFRDLDASERRALQRYREAMHRTLEGVPGDEAPDLTLSVMARLDTLETHRSAETLTTADSRGTDAPTRRAAGTGADAGGWNRAIARPLAWLWRPRPILVRPALAASVAAVLVLALGLGLDLRRPGSTPLVEARPVPVQQGGTAVARTLGADGVVRVYFRIDAPTASSVSLAGDFTDWRPDVRLEEEAPGVWAVVVPLRPGMHDYAFLIDGREWTLDPLAQPVDDGFGGQSSRVAVLMQADRS